MKKRTTAAIRARCRICNELKLCYWGQRGITHPEWLLICPDCRPRTESKYRRAPKPRNQLDLFAGEKK